AADRDLHARSGGRRPGRPAGRDRRRRLRDQPAPGRARQPRPAAHRGRAGGARRRARRGAPGGAAGGHVLAAHPDRARGAPRLLGRGGGAERAHGRRGAGHGPAEALRMTARGTALLVALLATLAGYLWVVELAPRRAAPPTAAEAPPLLPAPPAAVARVGEPAVLLVGGVLGWELEKLRQAAPEANP